MTAPNERRTTDPMAILALAALLVIGWFVRRGLLLIYVSMIFAILFAPAVSWIQARQIRGWSPGRGAALLLLITAVVLVFAVFAAFMIPPIAADAKSLTADIPNTIAGLQDRVRQLPFGDRLASRLNGAALANTASFVAATALKGLHGMTGALTGIVTVLLLTAYFILEAGRTFSWALSLIPPDRRPRVERTAKRAGRVVQRWLSGQLVLMALLGSASTVVLAILGVRYFYALGVFAALANFVPVLGPIATVFLAGLIAALDSWTKVMGVVIFYFVYQQVENAYLTPKIVGERVGLPGSAVLVALVLGSAVAGAVGALVAVPTAAIVATFVDEYRPGRSDRELQKAA